MRYLSVRRTVPATPSIGKYAFSSCQSLASFVVPPQVTEIKEGTFSYCPALTSLTIPPSVTNISFLAFGMDGPQKDLVIRGQANTYAQTYATEKSLTFVAIEE